MGSTGWGRQRFGMGRGSQGYLENLKNLGEEKGERRHEVSSGGPGKDGGGGQRSSGGQDWGEDHRRKGPSRGSASTTRIPKRALPVHIHCWLALAG